MLGEVVVVLDRLETDGLTVESEVMYRNGRRKEALESCCARIAISISLHMHPILEEGDHECPTEERPIVTHPQPCPTQT